MWLNLYRLVYRTRDRVSNFESVAAGTLPDHNRVRRIYVFSAITIIFSYRTSRRFDLFGNSFQKYRCFLRIRLNRR